MPSLFTQGHLVNKALLDVWENLAHKVRQVSREPKVLQVLWGHQEGRAFKDLQALLDGWGNLVHKGPQALWGRQESQPLKGLQDL